MYGIIPLGMEGIMSNPILNEQNFERDEERVRTMAYMGEAMTVNGTLQVTGLMGLIILAAAYYTWTRFSLGYTDIGSMLTGGGAIAGFILALIICFARFAPKASWVKYLIPLYATCEGLFLGGISATFEASYPGIVSTAIVGTFGALFSMLILYRTRLITCTDRFRSVIFIATLSIVGIYLVDIIGHFFGMSVPAIYSTSPLGILFSAVIVLVAAFNLIIDFDFIEQGAMRNFPKDYEWYGAFGLIVTIVWLYIEILRLLAKFQRR